MHDNVRHYFLKLKPKPKKCEVESNTAHDIIRSAYPA